MKFVRHALYEVIFWDHAHNSKKPVLCAASGYVIEDNDLSVVLTSWYPMGVKGEDCFEDNCELFSLLKSCIVEKTRLKSGKEKEKIKSKAIRR